MLIEKIEGAKRKRLVRADGEIAFACSFKELQQFRLEEGRELSKEEYEEMKRELLLPRAKRRAMYLLQAKDRSEAELFQRLKAEYYPDDVIEGALAYVRSYRYIDDARYAKNYARAKMACKSEKEIRLLLKQKGVAPDVIDGALEAAAADLKEESDEKEEPELLAIRRYLEKKGVKGREPDDKEKQKFAAALFRKGFAPEHIRSVLSL